MSLTQTIKDWFKDPTPEPYQDKSLSPELLQRIKAIQVKTNYLVNDIMVGEYVSAFKGQGMEFSSVREYQAGDDVRLIDWNVTARMDQPFIKEFKEERELTVMLLVDVSSSGEFGSADKLKNEISAEIASILAFTAIKNNDKIGLIVFSDKIEHTIHPKKGKAHVWNIIRTILNFKPEGKGTNLALPLEYLLKIQKRKATAFLISDFQDDNYEAKLKLAKQKHDLVAITIVDPREETLPDVGFIQLEDAETGETLLVDTHDKVMTHQYAKQVEVKKEKRKKQFRSIGIDTIELYTNRSLTEPIIRYFKMREKKH
ncbi:MAG: DUF58 domain-containing protein [Nitrospinaceae bacterium]|nr:DUF58 domain-containing protein [Nitrospina sp.]MBT5376907.1 DUF58 domain-containing protein [Nitrospinaceae bacterium]MBT5868430.1 DUF58 domain-containing protein [Nitrospinaceae bacterium]